MNKNIKRFKTVLYILVFTFSKYKFSPISDIVHKFWDKPISSHLTEALPPVFLIVDVWVKLLREF